jgi:folate-dependent phosphoribosylglycinamide formyltransferase PurN
LKKIHLFTNDKRIIKIVSNFFYIQKIFTEDKKLGNFKKKNKKVILINSVEKISIKNFQDTDLALSYGFGLIFKKKFIEKYPLGIWNIHPGDLPKYRSRHPISWAFLNNEKKIGLSIHIINEKIDMGILLAKKFISRTFQDDEKTVIKKIFKILPATLSLAIKNFKKKKTTKLKKGKYHKALFNGIKINNPKNYDYLYIYNAIKSQKYFEGLQIVNKRFKDVIFFSKKKLKKKHKIIECKNNKKIIGILK